LEASISAADCFAIAQVMADAFIIGANNALCASLSCLLSFNSGW
jgi:hypothetical protein